VRKKVTYEDLVPSFLTDEKALKYKMQSAPPKKAGTFSKMSPTDIAKMREIQLMLAERDLLYYPVSRRLVAEMTGWSAYYITFLLLRLTELGLIQRYYIRRNNERKEKAIRYYYNFGSSASTPVG
jgi:hypothetical protein